MCCSLFELLSVYTKSPSTARETDEISVFPLASLPVSRFLQLASFIVTFTIIAFNLKIVNIFLCLQNQSLVRDCRNCLYPGEHPRRRTHNRHLPYYTKDYGRRFGIWFERTVCHLVRSRGELFICRKRVAFRLGAESSDKSVPVPTDYRGGVLPTNAQVPVQKGSP